MIKSKLLFVILNILLLVFLMLTGAIPIVYKLFYYLIFFYLIANVLVNKSPFSKVITYIIVFVPLLFLYGGAYIFAILNNEDNYLGKPYFWGILLVYFLILIKNKFKVKNIYAILIAVSLSFSVTAFDYYFINSNKASSINQSKAKEVFFTNLNNEKIVLSSFKGKLTLIEFWTTSCGGCLESLRDLQDLAKLYETNDEIEFVTVNINLGKYQDTIQKRKIEGQIQLLKLNTEKSIFKQMNFNSVPSVLVLNNKAEIVYFGFPNFRKYSRNYLPDIIKNELNKM